MNNKFLFIQSHSDICFVPFALSCAFLNSFNPIRAWKHFKTEFLLGLILIQSREMRRHIATHSHTRIPSLSLPPLHFLFSPPLSPLPFLTHLSHRTAFCSFVLTNSCIRPSFFLFASSSILMCSFDCLISVSLFNKGLLGGIRYLYSLLYF